jgi:hypothetical protein
VWGDRRGEGERIFGREEDGDGSNRRRNDALPLRLWFFSHSLSTISCLACCSIFFSTSSFVVLTLWRRIESSSSSLSSSWSLQARLQYAFEPYTRLGFFYPKVKISSLLLLLRFQFHDRKKFMLGIHGARFALYNKYIIIILKNLLCLEVPGMREILEKRA